MPIYDYRCQSCGKASSIFFRSYSHVNDPLCPACGSPQMSRLVTKFAVLKGDLNRLKEIDIGRDLADVNPLDPSSVARWAKRMGEERGEALGVDLKGMAQRVEAGDTPSELYDPAYFYRYAVEAKAKELEEAGTEKGSASLEEQMGRPELKGVGGEP